MNKITAEEVKKFSKELESGYGFKDQPSGHCKMCKWDDGTYNGFWCQAPQVHLTNLICIQKRIMVSMENMDEDDD